MTPEQQAALAAARQRLATPQAPQQPAAGGSPAMPAQMQPQPSEPYARAGGRGAFMAGVGDSAIKGYLGLKQMVPGVGLSDENKAVLRMIEEESAQDPDKGTRTLGGVAGNIAALAVPGNAVQRGVQGLKILANTGRALPYLGTAAAAGATELATAVGEGDTYLEQMGSKLKQGGTAAAAAPVLQKSLKMLAAPVTGLFKPTAEATQLIAQGVNPTLQQGAQGRAGRFIGGLTSGITDTKNRLRDEIANAWLKRASGGQAELPSGTGGEFLGTAEDMIRREYSQLFDGKKVNVSPKLREELADAVRQQLPKDQSGADANQLAQQIVANRFPAFEKNMRLNYDTARSRYRDPFNEDMFAPNVTDEVRRTLGPVRERMDQAFHAGLSPDEAVKLKGLNTRNFDVQRMEQAVRGSAMAKEGVDINRLASAYASRIPQAQAAGNDTFDALVAPATRLFNATPTQDAQRTAINAAKKVLLPAMGASVLAGVGPVATALSPLVAISALGQTGKGAKALMGQTELQKALVDALRRARPATSALQRGIVNNEVE